MNYLDTLRSQFNNQLAVLEKRPEIHQLVLPLYHEDGDMMEFFLEKSPLGNGYLRISDYGMTLMRLSYSCELDTPKKEEIFHKILSENRVHEENGNIFLDVEPEHLYPSIMQLAQAISKVSSMRFYKREVIQSLFMEILEEFVESQLQRFYPQKSHLPIPDHDEYEVDYCFNHRPRPIYLFGVNNKDRAHLAIVSCQKFMLSKISFRSLIILDSLDTLSKKDQARLMSVADKQFPTLDDFKLYGEDFLERELTT